MSEQYLPIVSLRSRPRIFALAYAETGDVYKAALEAGIAEKLALRKGRALLKTDEVQTTLRRVRAIAIERSGVTVERVIAEYAKVAFASIKSFVRIDDDGNPQPDLKNVCDDDLAAVDEVTTETYYEGKGDARREVKKVRIKLHDKLAALGALGKHLGAFEGKSSADPNEQASPQSYTVKIGNAIISITGAPEDATLLRTPQAISEAGAGVLLPDGSGG